MHGHRTRIVYVIQIAQCMVCHLGLSGSGVDHMVMAAVIDFLCSFVPNFNKLVNFTLG